MKEGHYLQTVADFLGIRHISFYEWITKGEEQLLQLDTNPDYVIPDGLIVYAEFTKAFKSACAFAEMDALRLIKARYIQGEGWTNLAWFLERRFGKRWQKEESPVSFTQVNNYTGPSQKKLYQEFRTTIRSRLDRLAVSAKRTRVAKDNGKDNGRQVGAG
jgi:hypothetical protein